MPQPIRIVAQHTLTIDLGDGTQIPLGTFTQDQDGQLDNGTGTGGHLELCIDGHSYGALTISAETGKPVIGLAQYELAWTSPSQSQTSTAPPPNPKAEPEPTMTTTPQTRTVREWAQLLKTRQCSFTDLPADLQAIWLAGWAEADHDAEHRITQLTNCYDTALATARAQAEQGEKHEHAPHAGPDAISQLPSRSACRLCRVQRLRRSCETSRRTGSS